MAQEKRQPRRIRLYHVVVAVVVASAVFIGYLVVTRPPGPPGPGFAVQQGDTVTVDYIGFFEDGRVFDTSIEEVAKDDARYPKALSFELRGDYAPLEFVATTGPEATVIVGFAEGVLGMREGERRLIDIPPAKGYGSPDPSLVEVRPMVVELPQFEHLTVIEFSNRFGRSPTRWLTLEDPQWKWNVTVTALSQDFVTVMHIPEQGMVVSPFGTWPMKVLEVDSSANDGTGRIVVQHLLKASDAGNINGEDAKGTFIVVDVDLEADTYTVDYNREVVGKTLFFEMRLLSISRP